MGNYTEISAGGLEIKVSGSTVLFTIGKFQKLLTIAELESMLSTHAKFKCAAKQIVDSSIIGVGNTTSAAVIIDDVETMRLGIINISEALQRAD